MGNLNKVVLVGNLTRNPEVKSATNTTVTTFGLAVNRKYKSAEGLKEETCFIDIVAFAKLAEIAGEYLAKGAPVLIEGRLSYNTWEQEGVKKSKHEVVAENIQFLQRKEYPKTENKTDTFSEDLDDIDIPFV